MPTTLTPRPTGTQASAAPATLDPFCWIMVKPEWLGSEDDDQALVRFAKKAAPLGYNGLLMWDWDLSRPQVPNYTRRLYDTTCNWMADNGWSLCVECCPQGAFLKDSGWSGVDDSMYEPGAFSGERYICLADPRVHGIYEQIAANIAGVFPAGSPLVAVMAAYDEWRIAGKHQRCSGEPSGVLLARHAQKTMDLFRAHLPWVLPAAWSDMFNPFENARARYYNAGDMTRAADFARGFELIIDWSAKKEAFQFFAQRGCQQVNAGFYDWDPDPRKRGNDGDNSNPQDELAFCKSVAPYACGYMYTTWDVKWDFLKDYANGGRRVPWQTPQLPATVVQPPTPPPPPPPTPPIDLPALLAAATKRATAAEAEVARLRAGVEELVERGRGLIG